MYGRFFLASFIDDPKDLLPHETVIEIEAYDFQDATNKVATMFPNFANLKLREQTLEERLE